MRNSLAFEIYVVIMKDFESFPSSCKVQSPAISVGDLDAAYAAALV